MQLKVLLILSLVAAASAGPAPTVGLIKNIVGDVLHIGSSSGFGDTLKSLFKTVIGAKNVAKNTIEEILNIKVRAFTDILTLGVKVILALGDVINASISELGTLVTRTVAVTIKIIVCFLGGAGDANVCSNKWNTQFGVSASAAVDVQGLIRLYGLSDVYSRVLTIIRIITRGGGIATCKGSLRVVLQVALDLASFLNKVISGSYKIVKTDLIFIYHQIAIILGAIGNSHKSGSGLQILEKFIPTCNKYFISAGYPSFGEWDNIRSTISVGNGDNAPWSFIDVDGSTAVSVDVKIGSLIGSILKGIIGVTRLSTSLVKDLVGLVITSFDDVITLAIKIVLALGGALDSIIAGLGSLVVRIVAALFQIVLCFSGGSSGKYGVCRPGWSLQFGVNTDPTSVDTCLSLYGLTNVKAAVNNYISIYYKGKESSSTSASVQIFLQASVALAGYVDAGQFDSSILVEVYKQLAFVLGGIINSNARGVGTTVCNKFILTSDKYLAAEGFIGLAKIHENVLQVISRANDDDYIWSADIGGSNERSGFVVGTGVSGSISVGGTIGGVIGGLLGGVFQVVRGVTKLATTILTDLFRIKINAIADVFNLIIKLSFGIGGVIDATISGLGSLFVRIVAVILKIGICVNGFPGDRSICNKGWNSQYGVNDDANTQAGIITLFDLGDVEAKLNSFIYKFTSGRGVGSTEGSVRIILQNCQTAASYISGSKQITKQTITKIFISLTTISAAIANSNKQNSGTQIVQQLIPTCNKYLTAQGYPDISDRINEVIKVIVIANNDKINWTTGGNTSNTGSAGGNTGNTGEDSGNTGGNTDNTGQNTGNTSGNTGEDTKNTGGNTGNTGEDTGNTSGNTGEDTKNTGGNTGNTGEDSGNTSGNTGEDTKNTGGNTGNTGEDSGNTSGNTGEDTKSTGGNTGNTGEDTGNTSGNTGEDTKNTGGNTGNTGEDTGNTSGNTGEDTKNTGGNTGNTGEDTGNTSGNTGEDTKNTGGNTGNTGEDTGNTSGNTGEDTKNTGGNTGNTGEDTGNTSDNTGEDTKNNGGNTGNTGEDTGNTGEITKNNGGNTGNTGEDTGNTGGNTGGHSGGNNGGSGGVVIGGGGSIDLGSILGGILKGFKGVTKLASNIIYQLISIKINAFVDVLSLAYDAALGIGGIVNSIIVGLGSILARIIAVIFKIGICVNGFPGDRSICTKSWNARFGVDGDSDKAVDLKALFRVQDINAAIANIVNTYTKGKDISSTTGSVRIILQTITDLGVSASGTITKQALSSAWSSLFIIVGAVLNSSSKGSGNTVIQQIIPSCNKYFVAQGYPALTSVTTIISTISGASEDQVDWKTGTVSGGSESTEVKKGDEAVDQVKDLFKNVKDKNNAQQTSLTAVLNISVPTSLDDVINFAIKIIRALGTIFDLFIKGFGSTLVRIVAFILRYVVCVLGVSKNSKCSICQPAFYESLGVAVKGESYADLYAAFEIGAAKANLDAALAAYSSKGLESLSGSVRVAFDQAYSLLKIATRSSGLVEADLSVTLDITISVFGAFGNSCSANLGKQITENLVPVVSTYLQKNSYPALNSAWISQTIVVGNGDSAPWARSATVTTQTKVD